MTTYKSPYSDSTRWLRGNLHAHTSCGRFMDLAVSGKFYAQLGYDFLAITDHNKTHDAQQIEAWSEAAGLVVVPGEENGKTDHIIELGVHEVTPTPSLDYVERAGALKQAGGFVIGCHPQEYTNNNRGSLNIRRAVEELHAIEIYNGLREGRGTDESLNVALWDTLLSEGHQIWAVATDDFHCQYVGPACGWVMVQVPEDADVTWKLIVNQLKNGAFYASTYPSFETLSLQGNQLTVESSKRCRGIRVIGPGGYTLRQTLEHELTWEVPPNLTYFRVEAFAGIKRAWSQPFFPASSANE